MWCVNRSGNRNGVRLRRVALLRWRHVGMVRNRVYCSHARREIIVPEHRLMPLGSALDFG